MKRRNFLGFLVAAPLAPLAAKLLPTAVPATEVSAQLAAGAMAATNFANLSPAAKMIWSRSVWQAARDKSFMKALT